MKIEQRDTASKKFLVALDGDAVAGTMIYAWSGEDTLIIVHTEVDPAFGGKGVGKELVIAAVDLARKHGLKIKLVCPFAKHIFELDPGLRYVLHP